MDVRAWRRFRKNRGAWIGALLVLFVMSTSLLGPQIAPFGYEEQFDDALAADTGLPVGPGGRFMLGADQVGRDFLSRLLYGGSVTMRVALGATMLAVLIGLLVGIGSGYFGGAVDTLAMRAVDVLLSLPFLLVVIAINRVMDSPGTWALTGLLGALSWTTLARVTRAKTMQVRELEFVQAARALGMGEGRILVRHVLPNVVQPAIILATLLVAQMILVESSMSFLGLGVRPPIPSWGSMLFEGKDLLSHAPRVVVWPGGMIVAAVFGFNLLGEGLRDALDPKA